MKILFITHHWGNNSYHSNYSGYQRLVYFISMCHNVTVLTWGTKNCEYWINNIKVIVKKTPRRDYFYQRRLLLSWYARRMEKKYDIIHALYCELGLLIKDKKKLITTVHVHPGIARYKKIIPDMWFKIRWTFIDKRVIKKARYNIAVSNNLLSIIRNNMFCNIGFIPHGIDTLFWNNENIISSENPFNNESNYLLNVLTVGFHGENIKLLKNIIDKYPEIHFMLISSTLKINASNVSIQSNISDEALRIYYHFADVMLRPLDFATANNSILESMSMNTPIITNNITGITDYLSIEDSFLANDEEEFFQIFDSIVKNKNLISEKRDKLKIVAKKYSWNNIASRIELIYTNMNDNVL